MDGRLPLQWIGLKINAGNRRTARLFASSVFNPIECAAFCVDERCGARFYRCGNTQRDRHLTEGRHRCGMLPSRMARPVRVHQSHTGQVHG
jgi:hypothetical protein